MAGDPQKVPLVQSLPQFAGQSASDRIARLGQAFPCHVTAVQGQIVTVAFDVQGANVTMPSVTIPIATSQYDWIPVQVGDKGYAAAAAVYLGGVSGIGGGIAELVQPGNLTALVFVPVSNKAWTASNGNQRIVQGPQGVLIQTTSGTITVDVTPTGILITATGEPVTIKGTSVTISNGGAAQAVKLADGSNSTILKAQ